MAWLVRCAIVAIVSQFVWSVVLSSAVNDIQIRGSKFDINNYRVSVTSKTAEKWSHFFGKLTAPALLVAQTNSTVQKIRSSTTPKIVEFKSMISNWWRSVVSKRGKRTDIELKQGIGKLYDESTEIWLDVWGDHLHHGFYPAANYSDHKGAQIAMVDNALLWGYFGLKNALDCPSECERKLQNVVQSIRSFVDVGCGVGGSSRHIASKCRSSKIRGTGISLSQYQVDQAKKYTASAGLESKLSFEVADATKMPFRDEEFDLVWSMESGEHMPDKTQFMGELVRVCAPGGRIIIVTWCHRELKPGEQMLPEQDVRLLNKISDAYYLPDWVAGSKYIEIARDMDLEDIRCEDWTQYVGPFWPAVIRTVLEPKNVWRLITRSGMTTIRGAVASWLMLQGFNKGVIKFVIITGKKKQSRRKLLW